jgi:uncharacterized protein (UPF0332 family)
MKDNNKDELIKYRLSKSKETFAEVKILINLKYYNTAINRLYYSAFYAVLGLLLKFNISAKTHSGVRSMFGLNFISQNKISIKSGQIFSNLFDKRLKCDYNDFYETTYQDVMELLEPTELLINEIEIYINQQVE